MEQTKKKARKSVRLIAQYQKIFSSTDGKAVLRDLIMSNFVFDSTMSFNPDLYKTDTHLMALREGQRNVVLRILSILKIDAEKYQELMSKEEED